MGKVSPGLITVLSLVISLVFAFLFYYGYIVFSFVALLVSAYFDALDGTVARLFNKVSLKGDFLDHLIDRYVDFIVLFALAISAYGNIYFGSLAIAGTFLTSYVGTQAQAIGQKRLYGGFPGRADRLVIILAAILIQLFTGRIYGFYIISWTLLFLGLAGLINSIYRAAKVYRSIEVE
jgi:phosphatidylglycerophosphate synthase